MTPSVEHPAHRHPAADALLGGALGALAGVAFGFEGCGWLLAGLVAMLAWRLAAPGITPVRAAALLGAFGALLCMGGLLETALALPAAWRLLAWLPLGAMVLAHGAGAALAAALAIASPVPPALRLTVLLPALWVALEGLLGLGDAAMPWLRVGTAHASGGPLAGVLPYGGALLAGGLTWSLAGVLALARARAPGRRWAAVAAAGAVMLVVAALGRVEWTRANGSLRTALLQHGALLSAPGAEVAAPRVGWYANQLTLGAADLIVTPQLALPRSPQALPAGYLGQLNHSLRSHGVDALVGLHLPDGSGASTFNGVLALGASPPQSYRKHRLFPFGEFLPLPAALVEALQPLLPAPFIATPRGPKPDAPLHVGGHRAALALCWEAAFADAWRATAATADLLVNMSSDNALASAALARQWRQAARARSLEFQKPLLRTSDVRGTFVVDHAGRLVAELPERRAGVLHVTLAARTGLTPYARWGDAVAGLGVALALCIAALGAVPCLTARAATLRQAPRRPGAVAAGQVLPLAAVLLVVVAALFYLMVHAGHAVQDKIRVTNAADAAAYSAAVVEARALNHDAWLNRAIVANEMAIAQAVSFASWVRYFANASDLFRADAAELNFFLLPNPQVARLDAVFGGVGATAYLGGHRAPDIAEGIVDGIGAVVTAHDAAAHALALSQQAVHASLAGGVRQQQIARQVAQAIDPALHADVLPLTHGFDAFTHAYARDAAGGDERGRLADVVSRSRDAFTRERSWTLSSFDIPLLRRDPSLKKRGGTDLVGFDEWRAVDTLELHGRTWGCGKWGLGWCDDVRRPIGWGAIAVHADGIDDARGRHGNAYGENPTTAERAESDLRSPATMTFRGLPDTRDIGDTSPSAVATTGITVRVSKPIAASPVSGDTALAHPSGRLALFGAPAAVSEIAALSRAEVFFDRIAARADGKEELGSLYNPYWRVRLVAPTAVDRSEAAARQGGLELP